MTKQRFPIATVLRHYGADMVPTGTTWKAVRCPLHDDKHPSAQVNTQAQLFRCHVCDFFGDAVQIIIHQEGVNYPTAVNQAETITGQSNQHLSAARREGSLLPPKAGNHRNNSRTVPSWLRRNP